MIYGSICSGIEAASVAWHPLGWRAAFLSEIEPFARAVLHHHYKDVPLHGDFITIKAGQYAAIDVLVGGTPCQSFSVAGLRGGLADERGNLALEYFRLADRLRPRWLVWENVPGVLSSDGGRDFGSILGAMAELGYGFAYRVLDAQHFGVPQRRRRIFVIGHLGDWRPAAAVLFEPESLRWNTAPGRETGQGVARPITSGSSDGSGYRNDADTADNLIHVPDIVSQAMSSKWSKGSSGPAGDEVANLVAHSLRGDGFDASEDGTGRGTPLIADPICANEQRTYANAGNNPRPRNVVMSFDTTQLTHPENRANPRPGDPCHPLSSDAHPPAVAFDLRGRDDGAQLESIGDTAAMRAASGGSSRSYVGASTVRRLTPRECERLQGFPDDYTLVPYRNKPAADGPRYRALGNSMAVPVMRWIGQRIAGVDR